MKTIIILPLILVLSISAFAQAKKVYTAISNGNWNTPTNWSQAVRTDGVPKDKYIIPSGKTITVNTGYNYTLLGDVEVLVMGTLLMGSNATLNLTQNSRIEVLLGGIIRSTTASAILIGNSVKFLSMGPTVLTGPVYTDYPTIGFAQLSTLPIDFLSFTATNKAGDVQLTWTTSNEINNSHFEIEVSVNGRDWLKSDIVKANHSNGNIQQYSFNHKNISGTNLSYRLKQVDLDGKFVYSKVVVISSAQKNMASIFSSNKTVNVEFSGDMKSTVNIHLMNSNGQVVLSKSISRPSGKISISANGLHNGIYTVHVSNENTYAVKQVFIN